MDPAVMFYSTDSLRQEALVSDTSLIVQPRKQNGGASRVSTLAGIKHTNIALKLGLRLMKESKVKIVRRALRVFL